MCFNSSVCSVCQFGYIAIEGNCLPCSNNCTNCSSARPWFCLACEEGFYLNPYGTCSPCPDNCIRCTKDFCLECPAGYEMNITKSCIAICKAPCATCSPTNGAFCTTCLLGYVFNSVNNTCDPSAQCSPTSPCTVCPSGYALANNTCFQCAPDNCIRCTADNVNECTVCAEGTFFNEGLCSKCP